jgi:hypothetical protein
MRKTINEVCYSFKIDNKIVENRFSYYSVVFVMIANYLKFF